MPNPVITDIKARRIFGARDGKEYATLPLGLYIVSEGFSDEFAFQVACSNLLRDLRRISPFYYLKDDSPFAIYTCYSLSSNPIRIGSQPYDDVKGQIDASSMDTYFQTHMTSNNTRSCQVFFDYTKLVNVCKRVRIFSEVQNTYLPLVSSAITPDPNAPNNPSADINSCYQYVPGAIIILTPKAIYTPNSNSPLSGAPDTLELELEHNPVPNEPLLFSVTSANGNYARVAARMLGLTLGLGNEFEKSSGSPSLDEAAGIRLIPNLIYASNQRELEVSFTNGIFKWTALMSGFPLSKHNYKTDSESAPIDDNEGPLVSVAGGGLWEGGGGYSNKVYRAAHDCIMRQKPGFGKMRIKSSQQPFCKVCWIYILDAIDGQYSLSRAANKVTLSTQKNEYSKIKWDKTKPLTQPVNLIVDHRDKSFSDYPEQFDPVKLNDRQAFWGFTCLVNPTDGFLIKSVNVHQPKYYDDNKKLVSSLKTDFKTVFESISFKNMKVVNGIEVDEGIKVEFNDDDKLFYIFDIKNYIAQNKFVLNRSYHGYVGSGDEAMYQNGLELVIIEDSLSLPHMELTLSCVMRAPGIDFDPGGLTNSLKIFPQIQFKWKRRSGLNLSVTKFLGTVRLVANVKHHMLDVNKPNTANRFVGGMHHGTGMHMENNNNDVSCFADANISHNYTGLKDIGNWNSYSKMRRKDVELGNPFPKPTWASIFDYYYPHAVTGPAAKEFTAVYGPGSSDKYSSIRKIYVNHLVEDDTNTHNDIFITKFPRQGAYDNIHVNGEMGNHVAFAGNDKFEVDSIKDEPIVAAPVCGVDCFHYHWRWSLAADTYAGKFGFSETGAAPYRGWSSSEAGKIPGASLIPPNQELAIRLSAKDPTNPKESKIVESKVIIIDPAPNENQVILEQGVGWAMNYASLADYLAQAILDITPMPIPRNLRSSDQEKNFSYIYDFIRFHHKSIDDGGSSNLPLSDHLKVYNHAQVPEGGTVPDSGWPVDDQDVRNYMETGDRFNKDLYEVIDQIVINGPSSPSNTKKIEEL